MCECKIQHLHTELGTCSCFIFHLMKNTIFGTFYLVNLTGVDYFNWPGPEVNYFYSENGPEVIFELHCSSTNPKCPTLPPHFYPFVIWQRPHWAISTDYTSIVRRYDGQKCWRCALGVVVKRALTRLDSTSSTSLSRVEPVFMTDSLRKETLTRQTFTCLF